MTCRPWAARSRSRRGPCAPAGASAADQIAKLTALHDSGALTDAEFEAAKAKALA